MASMHVRVINKFGKTILSCPVTDLGGPLIGKLVSEHERVVVEQVIPPKKIPTLPSDCPFKDPPKFCVSSMGVDGQIEFVVDLPLILKGGVTWILLTVRSLPDSFSFKKSLRSALHKRVPFTDDHLVKYREWYDNTVDPVFATALSDALSRFEASNDE